ncbi:MAG: RNA-binding transcriptional accessory protein [Clostridia bacterium]|nr:RNA-binding transcriptional accessory protein [Clostridia bacterium]
MELYLKLAKEFGIRADYSQNIVNLIEDGNTIPFIARYRKEQTGSCDDQVLREFSDRLNYLKNLEKRKAEVASSIDEQGKWTAEIAIALENAQTLTEVEDIYRPYVKKRKTRATVAIEKGLEPLAEIILEGVKSLKDIKTIAETFIDEEKGVKSADEAASGALDIIAERMSDNAELRKTLRSLLFDTGVISTVLDEENEKAKTYDMYKDHQEKISTIPSHRILAINRGEKEECLKVALMMDVEVAIEKILLTVDASGKTTAPLLDRAARDSYKRLIFPSIEREIRNTLTDTASEQAIKMFEVNLRPYLMQPPLKGKRILGLDPAYRTGCKIAVIDESGNVLDTTVVYPTPPQERIEEAQDKLLKLIAKHNVNVISIGNGTASKESEIFVANMIKESGINVSYAVVNEAGASVYSASKLGATEFPEFDVSLRSAVSIARRLQDPLAELIKIDVKSIGVGQYQHDMPEKRLDEVLGGVVEDCVNSVGVDLNTASESLLSYVAGVGKTIAKNIVEYRKKKPFESRVELLKVNKLGEKAYEQCAGFLRLHGENVLDNTAVHPERYESVELLLQIFGYDKSSIVNGRIKELPAQIEKLGYKTVAEKCGIGEPTLRDIVGELLRPGRDIRDTLPPPVLRSDLMDMKDLKEGMELLGTVRNVIDFGVFIDIGVHQDGLVHISEISNGYVKHPSDVLKVGDQVKVRVLGVDLNKKKISLSLKTSDNPGGVGGVEKSDRERREGRQKAQRERRESRQAPQKSLDDMLHSLQSKFNKR